MIRPATPADVPLVLELIAELARYEKLEHQLELDADRVREHLFGRDPAAFAWIAMHEGAPVGFALFFHNFSTFLGRPGIHLEDLFVRPEHRGEGHGLALLRTVARAAIDAGCPRLGWNVLDWNELAIGFYQAHGAEVLPDWRSCRLTGDALRRMATG